ncbi:MAG: hypothetical protein HQM04_13180 [Magnetococcales bacterium]|nr:hypothetical protein [Magnetococcales bacterium]MBF0115980.1 hypothetical protein [Magnetococcales bacterium]
MTHATSPPSQWRIFVSVASYRDSETPWTLRDMFAKARHPERVYAGVLWQVAPEDPPEWCQVPEEWSKQVRGVRVDAGSSMGACWARSRIQQELWQDEPYLLQIDSHSRFAHHWDETVLQVLQACPSARPVLTTHPIRYEPPDTLSADLLPILTAGRFNDAGILMPKAKGLPRGYEPTQPLPSAFIGAGFVFASAAIIREVPYDPYLYFHGEEVSMGVRLWTHGYDLFCPNKVILYHDYTDRGRRRHWSDHTDWGVINRRAMIRLRRLLATPRADDQDAEALRDLERYGLGERRTLSEYEAFADVDFVRQIIGARAADGQFPLLAPESDSQWQMRRVFSQIYQDNLWKAWDTRSGPGSSWEATRALRENLAELFKELGVRILVDAGCGDLVWLAEVTSNLDLYLGFDMVPALIERNRSLYGHRLNHFFNVADTSRDRLPRGDALLCRNLLTHLSNDLVGASLRRFKQSEARYLLATTFPDKENRDIEAGQWRPVNLTAAPFSLPPPRRLLPDGQHGAYLGVWKMADW